MAGYKIVWYNIKTKIGGNMSLENELKSIDYQLNFSLPKGTTKSIEEFFDVVIKPTLLPKQIVLDWNALLSEYIEEPDAVFAVRAFGSWSDKDALDRDKQLRRGFLTKASNNQLSYFFCDNYFTAIIAKLIYNNFCPTLSEFKSKLQSGDFPVRIRHTQDENIKAFFPYTTKNPAFGSVGYKIAHIVDSGDDFYFNNECQGLTELSELLGFTRGDYEDWEENSSGRYVRILDISEKAKTVLKAHFMRFVNPLNYFLAPKDNTSGKIFNYFENPDKQNGKKLEDRIDCRIAEYKSLTSYVNEVYSSMYGKVYQNFQSKILLPNDYFRKNPGKEKIEVTFGMELFDKKDDLISFLKTGEVPVSSDKTNNSPKKIKTAKQTTETTKLTLIPADKEEFKKKLLILKSATKTIVYGDGRKEVKTWNASSFTGNSNLKSNILSQNEWRNRKERNITEIIYEVK